MQNSFSTSSDFFSEATLGGCVEIWLVVILKYGFSTSSDLFFSYSWWVCCSLLLPTWWGKPFSLNPRTGDPYITGVLLLFVVHLYRECVPQAHGDCDEVVSYKRGQLTAEVVERLAKRHKMITYPGMGHEGTLVSRC